MTKLVLANTSGGYDINSINENFEAIQGELQNRVLYRDNPVGENNAMNNNLDMNGYRILNCPNLGEGGGGEPGEGTDGFSNALVYAYQRKNTAPSGSPGAITYDFATHTIIDPVGPLSNGWLKVIPEGADPLYVTVCTANNQAATDFINASEWSAPVILVKDGISALNTATVYAYQRTPTEISPSAPSNTCTYIFASAATTGLNNGWTTTIPPSFNGKYLWVITATAVSLSGTDTIPPSEWAPGMLLAQDGLDGENGGANGLNNASFYAYKRAAVLPTDNPGDVTYAFASASITTPSTDALANGWFKTPPAGANNLYVTVASASASTATDTVAAAEWTTPSLMGSNGLSVATVYVYQRTGSASAPPLPSATVTYTFATNQVTGLTNGWSVVVPGGAGAYLWVTTATAAGTTTDTIPNTEWAAAQLLAKDGTDGLAGAPGGTGPAGTRGTVTISSPTSNAFWTDVAANAAISFAGYGTPINRDVVTLYKTGTSFVQTRFYDNGSWLVLDSFIDGNLLVSGTLSASKITGGTFSGASIDIGSGQFSVNSVNGLVNAYNFFGYNSNFGNLANPLTPALQATNTGLSSATTPTMRMTTITAGPAIEATSSSSTGIAIEANGAIVQPAYAETAGKGIICNTIQGSSDNVYYCGTFARRWAGITSATAVVVTSDKRLKDEIKDSPLGLSFVNDLRPVSYTLKPGTRRHYGLIAQEVKEVLDKHGANDAAFWLLEDKDNPDSQQALRYEELIAPMLAAIQELSARIKVLENK